MLAANYGKPGIFGAKNPSLAMRGFDKLDTAYEKARMDGGVTVAAAWRPHTGEFCPGAAASP